MQSKDIVDVKENLLGMTLCGLRTVAERTGMPKYAAAQMAKWLYAKHVRSIDEMTDISLGNRKMLGEHFRIGCSEPCDRQYSVDGTGKYLFPTADGQTVETVFIPDGERATVCVSSQVGCRMGCKFCMTGRQGFHGNLQVSDILNQIYSLPERDRLTNVVFMGQGEPMDNIDNVLRAVEILTSDYGYAWSPKRITVSTVGIRQGLMRFLDESECHLAVSLHSPFPAERLSMMPAEKTYGMANILEDLRQRDWTRQRRLSFEYIVFGGYNDDDSHIRELARLLSSMECRVNLIRFHEITDTPFRGADEERMVWIRDYLTNHGVKATIRASRGQDIFAACGLLHSMKSKTNATT